MPPSRVSTRRLTGKTFTYSQSDWRAPDAPVTLLTLQESRMSIPEETYRAIEEEIASDLSPVGIDAKKTHVMIIHELREIEARLTRIEQRLRS